MKFFAILTMVCISGFAYAQDDAFLSCADITDRAERVKCLEQALSEAVERRDAGEEAAEASLTETVEVFGTAQSETGRPVEESVAEPAAAEDNRERSLFRLPRIGTIFRRDDNVQAPETEEVPSAQTTQADIGSAEPKDRIEGFGRQSRVVVNAEGEDELVDTVKELSLAKPNQWLIRLGSGQIWRQVAPKRMNLREGDEVRIYPSHWGDNYRLEATRLSGFIQVVRVE